MAAEDAAADDIAADDSAADVTAEVNAHDDSGTVGMLSVGSDDETMVDCRRVLFPATDQLVAPSSRHTAADGTELLASADGRAVSDCESPAGDMDAGAAGASVELLDHVAGVTDNDCVQVPVDAAATDDAVHDADMHNEPAAVVAALNEPQPAVAAEAEVVVEPAGNIIPPPLAVLAPQGLGDVHQAMMQGGGPIGFQPYKHPNLFALRVIVLCCLLYRTLTVIKDITLSSIKYRMYFTEEL